MQLILILYLSLKSADGSGQQEDKRKGRDGWGPGGWETRNGVSSYGWDSRRPLSCPRCQQPGGDYRGNGYDNLSPEWQQREQGKQWPVNGGGRGSGDGYGDKRVWSGTIRPIEDHPGGLVTNWMGGPSRWRDPWDQRDVQYWHSSGGGYAGGYGYTQGSSYGYSQVDGNKPTTYYDRSRGESGYINRYDRRPWENYPNQQNYARGWDYYEQRPGSTSGGGYTYRPPEYSTNDRKNLRDCNPCRERPRPVEIRPTVGCCGARPSSGNHRGQTTAPQGGPDYRADWYNRQDYDYSRPSPGYNGRDGGSAGWSTHNRPAGDYGGSAGNDYGRPVGGVTRPFPGSYGKPAHDQNQPWYGVERPNTDYGRPASRPPTDYGRPASRPPADYGRPAPDYSRPDYGRPGSPDYGRPSPDYGSHKPDYTRPGSDYGRPNPDYGRPNPEYGRPNPDYGRPSVDSGRPIPHYGRPTTVAKPSPADYGHPGPDYNQPASPVPDYGRPSGDYGRPQPDYGHLPPDYGRPGPDYGRPAPDYGRPPSDYERPSTDYGRPPTDYGRPPSDYGRPPPDYGRPGSDYGRPDYGRPSPDYNRPPEYGRPGCSTCKPDPDRPGPEQSAGYPRPDSNYDGYVSSGGYKPSGGSDGYGSGDRGGYPPAVSGGGNYGAGRPDDSRRDEQGGKSPLDRYPGHTGVGATFEFDSDRKQDDFGDITELMTDILQQAIRYSNEEPKAKTNENTKQSKLHDL